MAELLAAGETSFTELKNLIVWNKTNGGMGTFYRSKHELIFVFRQGSAAHTNSFGLGDTGRYRTNVWDYAGISSIGAGRSEELAMHPTVKPVALIADAIRDCSRRGEIILDPHTGGVRIQGPQTKEQKARLDQALERRAEAQAEVDHFAAMYKRARDEESKARWLEEWHFEQCMFDIINDILPGRYKARLENRSYRDGASRSGTSLEELRRNPKLRDAYVGED